MADYPTVDSLVRSLSGRQKGDKGTACCPAHEDSTPSLSITIGEHDRPVFFCHAGCTQAAVIAALQKRGLWPDASQPPPSKPTNGNGANGHGPQFWQSILPAPTDAVRPTATMLQCDTLHEYYDDVDRLLFYVRRIEARSGKRKQFLPLTYGWLDSKLSWHQRAPETPRPLFGLNRLSHAGTDAPVLLCEGEKAADAAMRMFPDHVAMTWCGGASAVETADWGPLTGRSVIIWPDADAAGNKAAAQIAKHLPAARTLRTSDLPTGFDAADLEALDADPDAWLRARLPPPPIGRIRSGADFIAGHVPPVWLIDGIVQRGRLYACTSLTGHGKTAVWLFNACMIHAGRMIGQLDVFQGNVLILAGENPADLEARMIAMAKTYNIPHSRLPYVLPGSFPLTDEEADALKREITGLGVPLALIVGDTAAAFFPGDDENDNVQSGHYARTLRSFTECEGNPAVVVLAHPTKNASRINLLPRGGGSFLNELDGNLTLWSENLGEVTELHWQGKIRGPDFAPFGYRLRSVPTGLIDEKDRPEMTIVVEPMSEEAVADHAKQALANEDVVLQTLRDHPDWSYAQICHHTGWVDDDGKPMKARVQRAMQTLATDKLIEQPRRGARWKITAKGREELARD